MFLLGQKKHILANTGRKTVLGVKKKPKGGTVSEIQERALLLQKISPKKIPTFNINSLIGIL